MFKTSGLFLLLFCFCRPVPAQITQPAEPKKWEASFFGGWATLTGSDSFLTAVEGGSPNTVRLDHESGYVLGLRITENLGRYFGAELEYSLADQSTTFVNLKPDLSQFKIDESLHSFSYSGIFYLTQRTSRIRPYGNFGVGATLYNVSGESKSEGIRNGIDLASRWKFAFAYGGGLKIGTGGNWGVRFDVRDYVTGVPNYGLPREAPVVDGEVGAAFRPDGLFHDLQFTAGLFFAFGHR